MFTTAVLATLLYAQVPDSPKIPVGFDVKHSVKEDVYDARTVYPRFRSRSAVANLANTESRSFLKNIYDTFMDGIKELEESGVEQYTMYDTSSGPVVSIAQRDFISLYVGTADYMGGAHPNRSYHGMTWGMVDGKAKRMKFADFLKDGADPVAVASKAVVPKLIEAEATWFEDGEITMLDEKMTENFVVTPAGITWLFSPYEAGPYTDGEFFIKVPWAELKDYLRSSLFTGSANTLKVIS